jgi:hypothetical protein
MYRVPLQDKFLHYEAEKPHDEHIRKRRSVSTKQAIGLPKQLPAKEMDEVLIESTAIKLYQELCQLRRLGAVLDTVNAA